MAAYMKIALVSMCLLAVLALTEAQYDDQGYLQPDQYNVDFSGSQGNSDYQDSYQGSQSGYQGSQSYQGSSQGDSQGKPQTVRDYSKPLQGGPDGRY